VKPRLLLPLLLLLLLLADTAVGQTLVLLSDINGRYGSTEYSPRVARAVETIVRDGADAVVAAGDMVAGQKQPRLDGPALDAMWASFRETVADPLDAAGIPIMISAGNHDASGFPAFAPERARFEAWWSARNPGLELLPGGEWPWRYAARLDGLLLVAFYGTTPGRLPDSERAFVDGMLAKHAPGADAIVVFSHLPMWRFTRGREQEILDDPELLGILHRHGVDVYASGHHHAFYAGTDEAGLLHLSVGALGGNVRPLVGSNHKQAHSFAVLEFNDGAYCLRAPSAPDFAGSIRIDSLPARIEGPLGQLQRVAPGRLDCSR
jgi:predicted phosphodiesterase